MRVRSDSAEIYENQGLIRLIGNARYSEDTTTITSDVMTYYERDAWFDAVGNVRATTGRSVLNSATLRYYRAIPGTRPNASGFATGRPHLELRDSVGAPGDTAPTVIDADRINMEKDSLFFAGGNVIITRPDVVATADSAETDVGRQFARLLGGSPRIAGKGDRAFTIEGTVLDVFGRERAIHRLLAKGSAVALSDSLRLSADTLDIRMTAERIDTVNAWGAGRAYATTPGRDIVANRLQLYMPGQRLERLFAYGRARAETKADSTIRTTERDWIEGDTLVAEFEPGTRTDTTMRTPRDTTVRDTTVRDTIPRSADTTQAVLRSLVATVNARSFYQIAAQNRADSLPAINYVTGRRIELEFTAGEVRRVRVTGDVRGVNGEPVRPPPPATPPRRPSPAVPDRR